jgi:predicted ATPase/DNA-binding XRE family transcriptional regulator
MTHARFGGGTGSSDERSFAALLLELRLASDLSQEELATASGVSVRTISDLERGRRSFPQAESARLLAGALTLNDTDRERFFSAIRQRRHLRLKQPSTTTDPDAILGRAAAIDRIEARIETGDRIVTLLGPGGIGKTRLARAIADRRRLRDRAPIWISLDSIASHDLVLSAILRAVDPGRAAAESPIDAVVSALGDTPSLLILDNVEHLIDAAPDLSRLLDAVPGLTLLVTSREPLRLAGEAVIPVDPLPLPDHRDDRTGLSGNPAVALFMRTLNAAAPTRSAQADDHAAAAEIVRLLDGLPLAIELAAAQGVTLPLPTISTLLETAGLAALGRGRRDGPGRFQTMESAIAWSADLLTPDARRLFRLLGAFRGGMSMEAIVAVTAASGQPGLVGRLPLLAESQLILSDVASPGARLRMLEPIRMFAMDRLRTEGEEPAIRRAHAAHFLRWMQEQGAIIASPEPIPGLDAVDADLANIQVAIATATTSGDPLLVTEALRGVSSLSQFWEIRLRFREGRAAVAEAIAAAVAVQLTTPGSIPPVPLMEALYTDGYLAYITANPDGIDVTRTALRSMAEESGSPEYLSRALVLDVVAGELAGEPWADLLEMSRTAHALVADGEQGASWQNSLLAIANIMAELGDLEGSLEHLFSYADWASRRGNAIHARGASSWLGLTLLYLGRGREARQHLADALQGSAATGIMHALPWTLLGIAAAISGPDAEHEDLERAAQLHGAFEAQLDEHGYALTPRQHALHEEATHRIEAALGDDRYRALLAEGRTLSIGAAVDLARA